MCVYAVVRLYFCIYVIVAYMYNYIYVYRFWLK